MRKTYLVISLFIALSGCKKDIQFTKSETPGGNKIPIQSLTGSDTLLIAKSFTLNHVTIPFDRKSATLYFPASSIDRSQEYTLNFTSDISSLAFDGMAVANNKSFRVSLKVNQVIKIRIYDKKKRKWEFNMVVTGLPIVNLTINKAITSEIAGTSFTLIDPDYKLHKSKWAEISYATVKVRGASSRIYPKKSYAFKITDAAYEDADMRILGLREDNSWILDAMYVDQARIRNRVCTDIWNTMNNVPYADKEPEALNGTRGYLVETFINDEYRGVYCLTEKLDRKQLKAKKKTGLLYKADVWEDNVLFRAIKPYDNNSAMWGGWSFDYPEIGDDPIPDWKPLYDFIDFVTNANDKTFIDEIANKVDINNVIDYFIFVNAFAANDNTGKNTFFSTYDYPKTKFFFSAWDLDGTLGRDWYGVYYQKNKFEFLGQENRLFYRLSTLNPEGFRVKFKQRWNELKTAQLSKSEIDKKIKHYTIQLVTTHAGDRERARWSNVAQDFDVEARYMSSWYSKHYDALDKYITSIPGYNK